MMRSTYRVEGFDRETGERRSIKIVADSQEAAMERSGLVAEGAETVGPPPDSRVDPLSDDTRGIVLTLWGVAVGVVGVGFVIAGLLPLIESLNGPGRVTPADKLVATLWVLAGLVLFVVRRLMWLQRDVLVIRMLLQAAERRGGRDRT